MLFSRTQGAASKVGATLANANTTEQTIQLASDPECRGVVIDLRTPGIDHAELVAGLRAANSTVTIVACGPHVHEASLNAAREAGCDVVATRGQFERDAEAILTAMSAGRGA